ncbi:MAG: 1-acyl-sn-glycerol-3-phosphate acyltransferase, partial [Bacteroidales bacterium]|nr:1-acyl-sn-glycerol-3-phosphate acyltransferase [Bacteroidales bacterium]
PDKPTEQVRDMVNNISTIADFQRKVMFHANERIIAQSITEFTFDGMENIENTRNYVYLSNHRDIMLDASLLQNALIMNGLDTTEITFGANLMQGQLVIDIGKSNKMFRVERPGGSIREFYKASMHLSDYIRHTIVEKKQSVWIAQRNGRTKDGTDRTDQGIINMFRMSSEGKSTSLSQLNLLPVSVSYEWEPCDILKTLELYAKRQGPYIKKPGEDLNSILTGILQPKGRVHFHICEPISELDMEPYNSLSSNDFNKKVASLVDQRICSTYKLWSNNYIAHDMLSGSSDYASEYDESSKAEFLKHLSALDRYENECNVEELKHIMLGIYASPVDSALLFSEK